MKDFCSANTETINDGNYMQRYGGASCLPNGGAGFPDNSMSTTGIINKNQIDRQIEVLLPTQNAIGPQGLVATDLNPAGQFSGGAAALRTSITNEYCFYYKRYMYILSKLLTVVATTSSGVSQTDITIMKQNTEQLNSKLNQILQLLQGLVNSRLTTLRGYYGQDTGVNQINRELDKNRADLIKHTTLLKSEQLEVDLRTAMIDYTLEKNSSSRNLLAIYAFMNIVAAGLIYYLHYRTLKLV
jgi:hypothetical protein